MNPRLFEFSRSRKAPADRSRQFSARPGSPYDQSSAMEAQHLRTQRDEIARRERRRLYLLVVDQRAICARLVDDREAAVPDLLQDSMKAPHTHLIKDDIVFLVASDSDKRSRDRI